MEIFHSSFLNTRVFETKITNERLVNKVFIYIKQMISPHVFRDENGFPEYINIYFNSEQDVRDKIYSSIKYENYYGKNVVETEYFRDYNIDMLIHNMIIFIFEERIKQKPTGYY